MLNKLILQGTTHIQATVVAARARAAEQEGATTVEYIMILGIMAVVVAFIFLGLNWKNSNTDNCGSGLSGAVKRLGAKIQNLLDGVTPGGNGVAQAPKAPDCTPTS